MIAPNRHIISTIEWESSFDNKAGSYSLQDRISYWSKYKMPRHADSVFSTISSPYITWQIDKLTIDLGTIFLDDLEHDLSLKFKKELSHKLMDLLLNAKKTDKNIKIVHRNISMNSLLEYYLQKGSMPWNFSHSYGSINEILDYQLRHNTREVIYLLRHLGKETNVRKRIAWQLNEKNQKILIDKLEPYYNAFIGDSLDEIIQLQYKFKVVPSHISVFKKYLNFWALNYLFSRNNLAFSKSGFIASIMRQMAHWYSIDEDSFYVSIQAHSQKMKLKHIPIFEWEESTEGSKNSLSLHKSSSKSQPPELERSWIRLKEYLEQSSLVNSNSEYNEYNDLVHRLYFQNPTRFIKLLSGLDNSTQFWERAVDNLSPLSFEVLVEAFVPTKARRVLSAIKLLSKIGYNFVENSNQKELWVATLSFLSGTNSKHLDTDGFLEIIIRHSKNFQDFSHVIDLFESHKLESADMTIDAIDIYGQLKNLSEKESIPNDRKSVDSNRIELLADRQTEVNMQVRELDCQTILSILLDHISNRSYLDPAFLSAQKAFIRKVNAQPSLVFHALIEYGNSKMLHALIPLMLDENQACKLLQNAAPEYYSQVVLIYEILEEEIFQKSDLTALLKNRLMVIAIQVIVVETNLTQVRFIHALLKELYAQFDYSFHEDITQLEQKIFESMLESGDIVISSTEDLNSDLKASKRLLTFETIEILISNTGDHKKEISRILKHLVLSKGVIPNGKTTILILKYLFDKSNKLNDDLIEKYTSKISDSSSDKSIMDIEKLVTELFWISVSDYSNHKGNADHFEALFEKCVQYNFSIHGFLELEEPKEVDHYMWMEPYKGLLSRDEDEAQSNFDFIAEEICSGHKKSNLSTTLLKLKDSIRKALTDSPSEMRKTIEGLDISGINIDRFNASIGYIQFVSLIACDLHNGLSQIIEGYKSFYLLIEKMGGEKVLSVSIETFWSQTLEYIKTKKVNVSALENLVSKNLDLLAEEAQFTIHDVLMEIENHGFRFPKLFINVLIAQNNSFDSITESLIVDVPSLDLKKIHEQQRVVELLIELILQSKIPAWFYQKEFRSPELLVNKIVQFYPLAFFNVLKYCPIPEARLSSLCSMIPLSTLVESISTLHPQQRSLLINIEQFYATLVHVDMRGVRTQELQDVLYKKILMAWTSSRWKILSSVNIWRELMWDICTQKNVSKETFLEAMESNQNVFPAKLKLGLNLLLASSNSSDKTEKSNINSNSQILEMTNENEDLHQEIFVKNAGIVLISSYLTMLFDRLGLTKENKFVDEESQLDAVHFTQFLVTGQSETEESLLPLNKLLCGLQPDKPIMNGISITDDQKALMEGLLEAAISHWPAIGDSSVMGFRGNWLVRDGILTEQEDKWDLRVDKRPYDLLINKSPFSFSIIKFPWMGKPIHVTWPY